MTFKAINWSPVELIGEAKTQQMGDNADWLYRNTPRALYTLPYGLSRAEGIKFASGRAIVTKRNRDSASVEVRFSNYFTTNCQPNITTGIFSDSQPRIHCTISGLGRLVPDHRGFQAHINVAASLKKYDTIRKNIYVTWEAMGY